MSAPNDHARPMSCASDLSTAAGLPPVAEPTIRELQAQISDLKARIARHEDVFYKLSTSVMHYCKKAIEEVTSISSKLSGRKVAPHKEIAAQAAMLGLQLIATEMDMREHYIKPNMELLPPEIQIKLDELNATAKL